MTCRQLYLEARRRLSQAGIDSPGVDAVLLSHRFLGLDRPGLALHGEEEPAPEQAAAFLQAVEERAARRPLQYILGEWEFLGLPLAVGEGVLCPREDTAVLVESLAQGLQGRPAPRGLDLCAGTGACAAHTRSRGSGGFEVIIPQTPSGLQEAPRLAGASEATERKQRPGTAAFINRKGLHSFCEGKRPTPCHALRHAAKSTGRPKAPSSTRRFYSAASPR